MTVVDASGGEWESWPPDQITARGTVQWKTLVSSGLTPSSGLTAGTARIAAHGSLRRHRHAQPELYFVLAGNGAVTIDGTRHPVGPGAAVFIAGNAVHAIENTGAEELRFDYVLAADAFEDVIYDFEV